ncbi:MAG TPA: hypothetical protein VMS96_11875 [Terriglobales bacterium]|nr:hypothetical protein [Terriglobales bacterium]
MPTTLFEALPYDPKRERRRNAIIVTAVALLLVVAALLYLFRNLPYERVVDRFFTALEKKDFEAAYGIWLNDPDWKQNQAKHTNYTFHDFYVDWGPGGEWGIIRQHEIVGSAAPKGGSGVVVVVKVNERAEEARIWVERKDKTLTFSPY